MYPLLTRQIAENIKTRLEMRGMSWAEFYERLGYSPGKGPTARIEARLHWSDTSAVWPTPRPQKLTDRRLRDVLGIEPVYYTNYTADHFRAACEGVDKERAEREAKKNRKSRGKALADAFFGIFGMRFVGWRKAA